MCTNTRPLGPQRALVRAATLITLLGAVGCADSVGPVPGSPQSTRSAAVPSSANASTTYNNFYNVQVQREAFAIIVYFQYLGTGTPIFTLGTTPDVYESLEGWTPAKNMNNGFWWARVGDLRPGTLYYFRLEDLQSTWSGSAKTYRRQLIVDIDKIHVSFDGDAGIGCGELQFRTDIVGVPYPSIGDIQWMYTNQHCVSSGNTLYLSDAEGRYAYTDWKKDEVSIKFSFFEEDGCALWQSSCGDLGFGADKLRYVVKGGPVSYNFQMSTHQTSYPKVVWYGTVKTTFVP